MKQLSLSAKSWCLFDVANSVYATSVMTFIFPIYFKNYLVGDIQLPWGLSSAALLPFLTAFSLFLVLILSPILGARADIYAQRKKYLLISTILGSSATLSLGFIPKSEWLWASVIFVLANASFVLGTLFYNALLKEVSTEENQSRISGLGWAMGYAGGFLALIFHLAIIMKPALLGIDKTTATQISLMTSGLWWILFAMPLFLFVKEESKDSQHRFSLRDSLQVIPSVLRTPHIGLFIIAFFFFNDAIQTTISQAANLADGLLQMKLEQVLAVAVVIQAMAILGSFSSIWIEKKWGTRNTLVFALMNWCAILIWAFCMQTQLEFWILGIWIGLVLGTSQAAARTIFASLTPKEQSAEYFSVYSIADRGGAILGPLLFGLFASINLRLGILPLVLFIIFGTYLLSRLKIGNSVHD